MSHPSLDELLDFAVTASHAAVGHAMANLHRRKESDAIYPHDVKLALDRECQEKAEAVLRARCPDFEILGEETPERARRPGPLWIIDPIDGTVNFSHGLRHWCNSIALQIDGRLVVGVVQAPELGELFTATAERPSELNGQRIQVSSVERMSGSLALTGIAKSFDVDPRAMDFLRAVGTRVRKIRLLGAAALDLCQIACGRVEAFFEAGIYLWDMAAGDLIVRQAGGRSSVLQDLGNLKVRYMATNGLIHDELENVLREVNLPG